ncbi:MAG: ZINC PROTEASE [uncultured Chthoniobacterales bacterium]|uniref:ZINC PROTEASE n=1 Tax=uncultured Chthoniobacterales bacterium TaxID=1836801 RepID=A0A6J4HNB3_9BACT|nr:MAG: ZINC PROTEASE [uncultured Chthoniobacterales bacterium]
MRFRFFAPLALAAATLHAASPTPPAPAKVPGFTHVKTVGSISEYRLDSNGLQVLLMEEHSSPTLTFMVTYRVGSRNEVTGTTGATHLLEHLMFKGTPKFNREKGTSVDQLLEKVGGVYNATTWLDRTNYFANIGSEHLDKYIEIEADRMKNLWLRDADRKPEMTVVRNEFEIGENEPTQALEKEIFAAAYVAHPYHHSTIGWRSDIENVPIEKLQEFYKTFYWPDNATVSIIGDFKPADALAMVKKHYGAIPKATQPIPPMYTEEPDQTGSRRVTVKRAGELGVVGIGHKIPAARHADQPALKILNVILTSGKNSRFYRALTDKNLTTSVRGDTGFFHDPSLHLLYASLAPNATHEQVEKIAIDEIERVKTEGVTDGEVASAIAQILASAAYARDGSFAVASALNEYIAAGDWSLYVNEDELLKKVTAADVKRVANTYFQEEKRTTGWFIPMAGGQPQGGGGAEPDAAAH